MGILLISFYKGGAERVVSLILPYLVNDFDVKLYLFDNNINYPIPKNITVIKLDNTTQSSKLEKIFRFFIILKNFNKYVRLHNIDVSMSLLTRPNILNSIIKILNPRLKVIISERCFPSIAYKSSKFRYYLYKILIPFFYNKADILFSNSLHINKDLMENFGLKIKNKVVYNPIIITEFLKDNLRDNNEEVKIINIGSIYAIKNQNLLIEALENATFKYKVTFIGDGIMKNELQKKIDRAGFNDRFQFVGHVSNVNDYLLKNNIFVLTSNSEGFPNVVLEAMSNGLPVISTNCFSGPLEILNENIPVSIPVNGFVIAKYGILINVNDKIGLFNAINYLINNKDTLCQLSALARKRSYDYDIKNIYKKFFDIIQNV